MFTFPSQPARDAGSPSDRRLRGADRLGLHERLGRLEALTIDRLPGAADHSPEPLWKRDRFVSADDDGHAPSLLLPHVGEFLNPPSDHAEATAFFLELTAAARQAYFGAAKGPSTTHWSVCWKDGRETFAIEDVQLAWFATGVGMLSVTVRPLATTLGGWLDVFSRIQHGPDRGSWLEAQRTPHHGGDPTPWWPGGEVPAPASRTLRALLETLLDAARLESDGPRDRPWYRDVFGPGRWMPFTALFVEDAPEDAALEVVWRVRRNVRCDQVWWPPEPAVLRADPSLFQVHRAGWHFASLDGAGYVSCNAPASEYFRNTFPDRLNRRYFLLWQLALQQRAALARLSAEVADAWGRLRAGPGTTGMPPGTADRENEFREILESLLYYVARGHFVQVAHEETAQRAYAGMTAALAVAAMHAEVQAEVREMHAVLEAERLARLEALERERGREARSEREAEARTASALQSGLALFGLPVGVASVLLAAFQAWTAPGAVAAIAAIAGVSVTSGLVGRWWFRRRDRAPALPSASPTPRALLPGPRDPGEPRG